MSTQPNPTEYPLLTKILTDLRIRRGFMAPQYVRAKVVTLNAFFRSEGLDAAVLGLSGGIDSAVTLALLLEAQRQPNSPIKVVRPVIVPIHGGKGLARGVTAQNDAAEVARRLCDHYDVRYSYIPLHQTYDEIRRRCVETTAWAEGQMASILRTPLFYYEAAILQANQGLKSIVVGTTNRDEGSYIGFFGKASDGMVDLQPIADLHKSEVRKVAEHLDVTREILDATPKGDVWDGRVDEEMFGAPYWFLELYLLWREYFAKDLSQRGYSPKDDLDDFSSGWRLLGGVDLGNERGVADKWRVAIESQHQKNAHKYRVGSPARFVDVMEREVPGGW